MQRSYHRAFTIIELLVVVSIIALLVGILLPAIGKAREQAQLTQSQGNMKQLGTAAQAYAAEYADRQLTYCVDNLSTYGMQGTALDNFFAQTGAPHPPVILGWALSPSTGQGATWAYWMPGTPTNPPPPNANFICAVPVDYDSGSRFGGFRIVQGRQFSIYLNGRFLDRVFYAPKDTEVVAAIEPWIDHPYEFTPEASGGPNGDPLWSSYCFSPAGMLNPDVLSVNAAGDFFTSPWSLAAGFRSPSMGQAMYADLKTHIIEHHWLQNRRKNCNTSFGSSGQYNGCQPYFFNGSRESAPVTLYYDGHIANRGQRDAIESNQRVATQTGDAEHGLWSIHTPWQGGYGANSDYGYYMEACIDSTSTSYHTLTIDGIKGRDFLSK